MKHIALILISLSFIFIFGCAKKVEDTNKYYKDFTYSAEIKKTLNKSGGINLGNALDAPNEGDWGVTLQQGYFKLIRDAGFTYLRIPMRWSNHADKKAPYAIDKKFFDRTDWAVENALSNGFITIINMHHYLEMMEDPRANKERYLALWKQIAEHFRDKPGNLYFELLNEPSKNLTAQIWNDILVQAINVVRSTGGNNSTRTIVVGPVNFNKIAKLDALKIPDYSADPNILVTVHYYDPMPFTHQGTSWIKESRKWLGTKWTGTNAEKNAIRKAFDKARDWAKKHNRKIFLGEFGSFQAADMDSRVLYADFVAREAERHGFTWCYWEFCSTFGICSQQKKAFRVELLNALNP